MFRCLERTRNWQKVVKLFQTSPSKRNKKLQRDTPCFGVSKDKVIKGTWIIKYYTFRWHNSNRSWSTILFGSSIHRIGLFQIKIKWTVRSHPYVLIIVTSPPSPYPHKHTTPTPCKTKCIRKSLSQLTEIVQRDLLESPFPFPFLTQPPTILDLNLHVTMWTKLNVQNPI